MVGSGYDSTEVLQHTYSHMTVDIDIGMDYYTPSHIDLFHRYYRCFDKSKFLMILIELQAFSVVVDIMEYS